MTKLTLRKAAAVQNEIRNVLKDLSLAGAVTVTEFVSDLDAAIAKRHGEAWDIINRRQDLNAALYDIRQAVSNANQISGVSDALAQTARIESQIKDLETATKFAAKGDLSEVRARIEKMRNSKDERYSFGGYDRNVEIGVFTEEELAGFKQSIADLKRQRQNLRDKVLEANIRSEVTLSEQADAVLRREGIL